MATIILKTGEEIITKQEDLVITKLLNNKKQFLFVDEFVDSDGLEDEFIKIAVNKDNILKVIY